MLRLPAKNKLRSIILLTVSAACLITGLSLLITRIRATTGNAAPPDSNQTVTEDDTPDETKPSEDDISNYSVPADQPRRIVMPTIETIGLVQRVGVTSQNAVAAPSNINFAGWYTGSVSPGEPGLSIIDGHVSGKYAPGIFKQLGNLKAGDKVTIEYGDKSTKDFEVVSVKTVPESEAAGALFDRQNDIPKQLNLITCSGKFDRPTQTYADRTIVVTKLLK